MASRSLLAAVAIALAIMSISIALTSALNTVTSTTTLTTTITKILTETYTKSLEPYTITTTTTITTTKIIAVTQPGYTIGTNSYSSGAVATPTNASSSNIESFSSYKELAQYLYKSIEASAAGSVITLYGTPLRVFVTPTVTQVVVRTLEMKPAVYSKTNVQVEGVDELDMVKTDGKRIYFAYNDKVYIVDASSRKVLSSIELPQTMYVRGIFIYGDRLAVIATTPIYRILRVMPAVVPPPFAPPIFAGNTTVYLYDIGDPSKPMKIGVYSVSGSYVSSRLVGPCIYVVTQLPAIYGSKPVLPLINGTATQPSGITAIGDGGTVYIVLAVFNVEKVEAKSYVFLASSASRIYMTPARLYIVSSLGIRYAYREVLTKISQVLPADVRAEVEKELEQGNEAKALEIIREWIASLHVSELKQVVDAMNRAIEGLRFSTKTRIYSFSVSGMNLSFDGYTDVDGVVLDQFSMGEIQNGKYFVIATTSREITYRVTISIYTSSIVGEKQSMEVVISKPSGETKTITVTLPSPEPASPRVYVSIYPRFQTTSNNVFIIDSRDMKVVGELRGLAKGERIYAARIVGDLLFLVTFRRVDPLFAIDLSNPTKPKVIGYVKIPGYSEYLHPVAPGFLLGIGVASSTGKPMLKISLFNVTDPKNIEEIAKIEIPYGYTPALYDHHAVTIDLDRKLLFIPIAYRWRTIGVAEISFANKSLDLVGIAMHSNALRALYIGDELFTVSPQSIKVFDIATLRPLAEIHLEHR